MSHTYLPIIGVVLFSAGILILLTLLFRIVRKLYSYREFARSYYENQASLLRFIAVLVALVLVFGAQLAFWISGELNNYCALTPQEAACSLDIYTPADGVPRLIYSVRDEENHELVEVFALREAQMRVIGEIIEWPPWMGLGTYFKLTEVEFLRPSLLGTPITAYSRPIHQGSMPIFKRLSGWPKRMSLARTTTIQTPILPTDTNAFYSVFVRDDKLVLE